MSNEITRKIKQIELLERKKELREGLPHLHGFKLYKWQREFIESTNKVSILCAGNQIGKSSANILKWIHWATEPSLWPKLWPHRRPRQFWFLLPSKDMLSSEFKVKYEPEFLPRGEFRKRGQYAWEAEFRNRHLWAIHFTGTGVSIYMHTYAQESNHLQAGSVDAMFVDEEPPWDLMPELLMRTSGVNGYFSSTMTPTIGQDQWRRAFEISGDDEIFKDAFKRRVSVFDCLKYEDGSQSSWTLERINQMMNRLSSQQEIDLRIYGKFVAQEGLRVPSFDREKNVKHNITIENNWMHYAGVDIGSGGQAHPPAIVFVSVKPDFQRGYVTKVWKGDKSRNYTVTDIIEQYMVMRGGLQMTGQYYDFASAEFGLISTRAGLGFEKAEKSHDVGFPLMNALFKNQMVDIVANENYQFLVNELLSVRVDSKKINDDTLDAFRYAIAAIPWNFDGVTGTHVIQETKKSKMPDERLLRPNVFSHPEQELWDPTNDIKEFNDQMGFDDESTNYDW